jgi:hypothetical protein
MGEQMTGSGRAQRDRTLDDGRAGQWWGLPVAVALILTPLALLAHQYKFVNDDQVLYIPILNRRLDPSLYPGDYFFNQPQASVSLFEDLLGWPVHWLGLEWTMFLGYLLAQLTILLCVYVLALRLTGRNPTAYLAMALFILPVSVGGTFVRTYDNYLNPRTLTLSLGLLALAALWQRRPWRAAVLVALHLLLHPLSGLHTWLVANVLLAWWLWKRSIPVRALIGSALLLWISLAMLVCSSGGGVGLWLDPAWRDVLWGRTPYVFLASWKAANWISLAIYVILGLVGWSSRPRDARTTQLSLAVLGVALGATLAVGLGVDWLGLAPLAQLQVARSWRLVIVLGIIFGADVVVNLYRRGGWASWLVAVLLATAVYFDRGKAAWQPVLAVLLGVILISRAIERVWRARGHRWAEGVLAVGGLAVLLPAVLAAWWSPPLLDVGWGIPADALWPALLAYGLVLALKGMRQVRSRSLTGWAATGLGCVLVVLALLPLANDWRQRDWPAYFNGRLQLPTNDAWMSPTFRAWRDVQLWAAVHTRRDAVFVTDPDEKGFRVFSMRSPIAEEKDGAPAMFSRYYALEWDRRMQALAEAGLVDVDRDTELTALSLAALEALYHEYPFDYVVGRKPQTLPWQQVYSNEQFVVYARPPQ